MHNLLIVSGILLLSACGNQTTESTPTETDTSLVEIPETGVGPVPEEESVFEEYSYKTFVRSKFRENQISEDIYVVFDPAGIDGETDQGIVHFNAGDPLIITSQFNASKDDEDRNAAGFLYEVAGDEGRVVVSSASLIQMPYPKRAYASLDSYALNELNLVDSVLTTGTRHKTDPNGGYESESESIIYTFEKGITYTEYSGYEMSSQILFIPHMNAQQGFYFLSSLGIIDLFDVFDGTIPSGQDEISLIWQEMKMTAIPEYENGRFAGLSIFPEGGNCGEWIEIREENGGTSIETGGGC